VREIAQRVLTTLLSAAPETADQELLKRAWKETEKHALSARLEMLSRWTNNEKTLALPVRRAIQGAVGRHARAVADVLSVWSEMLTDLTLLRKVFGEHASDISDSELTEAHAWCVRRCPQVASEWDDHLDEGTRPDQADAEETPRDPRKATESDSPSDGGDGLELPSGLRPGSESGDDAGNDDDDELTSNEVPTLIDHEDETLLLLLHQRLRGPLMTHKQREVIEFEHILVDEAQDLSPVELSVVLSVTTPARSITLAGDVAQRLHMDNGFTGWSDVLAQLGLSHVEIEPLKLSYRSTFEIIQYAHEVLGPLAPSEMGKATRSGAPVELFRFAHSGDAVGFLAEALRDLARGEPRASIAVVARYPEQADLYFKGLVNAEVPNVRRVADQDFPFKPGVDVTDVRQVKGLEFDYVILLEANSATYPTSEEARHLMHIAATRAAHQLWLTCTAEPSLLIPQLLRQRGY
jgi:DNA helicase-2/ATP-dependent DNA helicase PcrA